MLRKMEKEAMAAILGGQESVKTLKMISNGSDPTVDVHLDNILHSFSLLHFLFDSSKSKWTATRSLNKKSSRDEGEEKEEEASVFHIVDSPNSILDDGFLWRKYGQKTIKGSPYQRGYYKCVNVINPNCNAKKQVQKIQNNPSLFRTTYIGQHMCQINDDNTNSSTTMIHFENQDQDMTDPNLPLFISVETDNFVVDDDLKVLLDEFFENDLDFNLL